MPFINAFDQDMLNLNSTPGARQIVLPKKQSNPAGIADTPTFDPGKALLDLPTYRDHLENIVDNRISQNSKELLQNLFKNDPDVSGTLNAYLAISNSVQPIFTVYNSEHQIDREGQKLMQDLVRSLTRDSDYSLGFTMENNMRVVSEAWRYMLLLRGAITCELILDKLKLPFEIRTIDFSDIEFTESAPGLYKPTQVAEGGRKISLDFPTIFINYFHRDPTEVYSSSYFVAAINTVAARQHLINTLYKIIQFGFPRIQVTVLEDIARKSAPTDVQSDPIKMRNYLSGLRAQISTTMSSLRPDQALVHMDSIEFKILATENGRNGAEANIESIISTLNDQNQAALKTMSTVLGRGGAGTNTSSVEARLFAMYADELNRPVAETWEGILTLAIRLMGFDGYVNCTFPPVELRPDLELEPQRIMKQTRLLKDLSLGMITDDEYHIKMYSRLAPDGVPLISGTGFLEKQEEGGDMGMSPNTDPLGKSLAPKGSASARSNQTK